MVHLRDEALYILCIGFLVYCNVIVKDHFMSIV